MLYGCEPDVEVSPLYRSSFSGIKEVEEGKYRVASEHAGACIFHDRAYLFSHIRLVAVHRAFAAGGLFLLKRAFLKTQKGIPQQGGTVRA